jgi:anti-sigma factor RsiW
MKKHALSPGEWENLSAYLDGELSPRERARFEKELKGKADLQLALEDLRKTRVVLRSQSLLRAPRNFTLTPQMAGMRKPGVWTANIYRGLRLSSALASLLLVLVVVGEFLAGGLLARQPAMAPEPVMQFALEQAPEPTSEYRAIAEEAESEVVETSQVEMEEAAKAYDSGVGAAPSGTEPAGLGGEIEAPAPTSMPMAEALLVEATPTASSAEVIVTGGLLVTPTLEVMRKEAYPTPASIEVPPPSQLYPSTNRLTRESFIKNWSPWRIAEIALVILAVCTGLTALILRRYHHK